MKSMYVFPNACLRRHRRSIVLLASVVVLGCGSAFAQSTDNATIRVTGTITGATCSLSTSDITLNIGSVDKSVFTGVNSVSAFSPILSLVSGGCDASLVSMTFTGTAATGDNTTFAVEGGAAGVGIQLWNGDATQYARPNDTSTPMTFTPAAAGAGYAFQARYKQIAPAITTGPANATITVLITYT